MNSTTAIQSQSLLDLAVQEYGTPEAVVQLAFYNQLSVTDELVPGQVLELPDFEGKNIDVADYFVKKAIVPATALTDEVFDIINNEDPCDLCKYFQ